MKSRKHQLKDGRVLLIREAGAEDARALLNYVEAVSGESDFLSFGPGEFELTVAEEEDYLRKCSASDNQLYIVGLIDGEIVSALSFAAGRRPRVRHRGEFGLSVRKAHWGLGIGSLMLEALLGWAEARGITKINLRVRTDNQRAVELYERRGFVIEGTIHREIFIDGQYFDHHWMGYEIRK
jgi:RimJ/RimL family protein N-acetyltransferase